MAKKLVGLRSLLELDRALVAYAKRLKAMPGRPAEPRKGAAWEAAVGGEVQTADALSRMMSRLMRAVTDANAHETTAIGFSVEVDHDPDSHGMDEDHEHDFDQPGNKRVA